MLLSTVVEEIPLNSYILLSVVLFTIGVLGVLLRRNMIIIFMSVELMLGSANLLLTSFSAYNGDESGQAFVFFVMVVAAAEIAVGLAILVMMYRNIRTVDIDRLNNLKW